MLQTAIILAGGFGTRLQQVVSNVPKPMAPVNGKPFLYWLLQYCEGQGLKEIILSTGYKGETIEDYFGDTFQQLTIKYFREEEPLGTGGAIQAALTQTAEQEVFILNGDTFFNIDLKLFEQQHRLSQSMLSIALKPMHNFDRYGVVKTDTANRVTVFEEKRFMAQGNINGGAYILNRSVLAGKSLPSKFSFEKDLFEKYLTSEAIYGFAFNDYFIDIGIPEDYERAQSELKQFATGHSEKRQLVVDKEWTVFLDRDGVINRKIDNGYVQNLTMFEWLPGAIEAIKQLSVLFGRVIIVTNQQGVGKGLMTEQDVHTIHDYIVKGVTAASGKIDRVYFSPHLKTENHPTRKPDVGMGLLAQKDFPEIDFIKSVIIGDSVTDMQFGDKLGMKKVFIGNNPISGDNNVTIDAIFTTVLEAVSYFKGNN